MAILYIDGRRLLRTIRASTRWLLSNEKELNEINVFPVPDGDTGTNMGATLKNILKTLDDLDEHHLSHVADNMANAALLGARGNSGVILSQILKGFAEGIGDRKRVDAAGFAAALSAAYEKAYGAVAEPREGTILTVVREAVEKARQKAESETDIIVIIETLLAESRKSLMNTPNLLPELKEAGVVDAGGLGFVYILEGVYRLMKGDTLPDIEVHGQTEERAATGGRVNLQSFFGYCNEMFVHGCGLSAADMKKELAGLGDSLVVAEAGGVLKIHIHSRHPDRILAKVLEHGIATDIKIENMDQQHAALEGHAAPEKPDVALIAVASGEGLAGIFISMGCTAVVRGGQTMNPSVEDLKNAVENAGGRHTFLLPNNGNIVLTANQVREMLGPDKVSVIPTKSIPQGMAALAAHMPGADPKVDAEAMRVMAAAAKTGEVTRAVKDSSVDGIAVTTGDVMALADGRLAGTFGSDDEALRALLESLTDDETGVISVFCGETVAPERRETLVGELTEKYPEADVEVHDGGQPHYPYILSVE